MHESVMNFIKEALPKRRLKGRSILEVGSCNVNGSPRDVINRKLIKKYIGVDSGPGRDVDLICSASNLTDQFGKNSFDTVISTEMLEHVQDWKSAVSQMKRVLCPGGLLLITTRSPGFPYHPFPTDNWRYTKDHFRHIFADMEIIKLLDDCPISPGVLLEAIKPRPFREVDLSGIEVSLVT